MICGSYFKGGGSGDVFISRRLNQRGQQYGFVRFFVVENVKELEKSLDKIQHGNRKNHVNLPKYRRYEDLGTTGKNSSTNKAHKPIKET